MTTMADTPSIGDHVNSELIPLSTAYYTTGNFMHDGRLYLVQQNNQSTISGLHLGGGGGQGGCSPPPPPPCKASINTRIKPTLR